MARKAKKISSQGSLNSEIKSICDIMRRSNCAGAMQYVPELTWILFLRILDERETVEAEEAEALGQPFEYSLDYPYRWRDWANKDGQKRKELVEGALGEYFSFINDDLIPHLKGLAENPDSNARQKVIAQIMSGVEKTRVDTEKNFLDVLDKVDAIKQSNISDTHIFTLSQIYEGLLLKMGEKGNDGGQFFTPREIIRAMIRMANPKVGEKIYDPCCGTSGFLAQAYAQMISGEHSAEEIETLKNDTFYGREKENLIYPISLANMILHGVDQPHIWHGNTLTGSETYGGLYEHAPSKFDVILTNPPFGGKEGKEAQTNFAYKTGSTSILFLQHIIDSLANGGRCAMVIDEGVLFRTNEEAYVKTKRKLLDDCNLHTIISLPAGLFSAAGAGVKTNILLFSKGESTEKIWYYDLSWVKVGKRNPFTIDRFDDFFNLFPTKADSEYSWTVDRATIEANTFDIKAVNPNRKTVVETRTSAEIIAEIKTLHKEIGDEIAKLGLHDKESKDSGAK